MALFHQIKQTTPNEGIAKSQERAFSEIAKSVDPVAALQKALEKRGRKPDPNAKQLLTLRLDKDVIEHFRSSGDGWQTRMNEALRKAAGL
jgi:uncharacterized protein (DUF4415 family)